MSGLAFSTSTSVVCLVRDIRARASHLTTLLASGTQPLHINERRQHLLNLLVCDYELRNFRRLALRTLAAPALSYQGECRSTQVVTWLGDGLETRGLWESRPRLVRVGH